jgi:hypothetical protein
MPALNDFVAHIITIEQGKSFPNKSQIIPESGRNVDGNTVTCFIPATSGNYFAAWWWAIGQRKNLAYSAEFIRDGESVVHLLFGPDDAAERAGVAGDWEDDTKDKTRWHFQFRTIECTGMTHSNSGFGCDSV